MLKSKIKFRGRFKILGGRRLHGNHWKCIKTSSCKICAKSKTTALPLRPSYFHVYTYLSFSGLSALKASVLESAYRFSEPHTIQHTLTNMQLPYHSPRLPYVYDTDASDFASTAPNPPLNDQPDNDEPCRGGASADDVSLFIQCIVFSSMY